MALLSSQDSRVHYQLLKNPPKKTNIFLPYLGEYGDYSFLRGNIGISMLHSFGILKQMGVQASEVVVFCWLVRTLGGGRLGREIFAYSVRVFGVS